MSRFGIQQLSINGTLYPGWKGEQIDRGHDYNSDVTDGVVYETQLHEMKTEAMLECTTTNLKNILVALGALTNACPPLLTLNGTTGLVMVGGKGLGTGPGYQAGSVHLARTALNGILWASGIRWSPMQRTELTVKGMFTSTDGVTDPVTPSLVAFPTVPTPDFGFALSSLTLNGTAITAVNSLDISIDPKFTFEYTGGLPKPTGLSSAGVRGALSVILRADIGDADLADGTGTVVAIFKQYTSGGGFGTASVTCTLNGNIGYEDKIGGTAEGAMSKQFVVRTVYTGGSLPLVITDT